MVRAEKQSSKPKAVKKTKTTKSTSEPVSEVDVAVTIIKMLLMPTPEAPRFDAQATNKISESDSDEDCVGDVDLNHDDDYLCRNLGEDSDDNEDGSEQGMAMKDCSKLKLNLNC